MKVVCLLALLVACVSAGPRPDKREAEIAEFGFTDTIKDAIMGKVCATQFSIERPKTYNFQNETQISKTVSFYLPWKILDVIKGQLTEENVERLVDFIKEKIDGGA